jgi:hypothetical protein
LSLEIWSWGSWHHVDCNQCCRGILSLNCTTKMEAAGSSAKFPTTYKTTCCHKQNTTIQIRAVVWEVYFYVALMMNASWNVILPDSSCDSYNTGVFRIITRCCLCCSINITCQRVKCCTVMRLYQLNATNVKEGKWSHDISFPSLRNPYILCYCIKVFRLFHIEVAIFTSYLWL